METENFEKAREIFKNAIEMKDPAGQKGYLDNACGGDQKLRAEVEALLSMTALERASEPQNVDDHVRFIAKNVDFARKQRCPIRSLDEVGDSLEVPAARPDSTLKNAPSIEGPGTKIGHYELLELIGEGGIPIAIGAS